MSKETNKKKSSSVVKNMMIALVGGLVVGLAFLFLREYLTDAGHENVWNVINMLLFQDITAEDGVTAIGLFYIIGQLFMRGLQLAIVPLVLVSLSLAMCSISSSSKLGRIAGRTIIGFLGFYIVGAFFGGLVAYFMKSAGLLMLHFQVKLSQTRLLSMLLTRCRQSWRQFRPILRPRLAAITASLR